MNKKELYEQVKQIEWELNEGHTDRTDATHRIDETLKDYTGDDRVIHFKDFKMPEGKGKNHIPSGIKELDDIVGGFGKGDIILLSGDTGDGKSTFARFLIRKLSDSGKKSLVFSYEETNEEFLSKFMGDLPDGYLPNILTDKSPVWIEARILEATLKYGVECVFVDNLGGIINYETKRNEVSEVDFIMQRLKEIAIKYNIVLFLLAHIKKSETTLIDKNSITGSKKIVNTASIGLALHRNREEQSKREKEEGGVKYTNYTTFYTIKNRYNGKYENFTMLYDPKTGNYGLESKFPTAKEVKELSKPEEIIVNSLEF